jgi:hypothetical protein
MSAERATLGAILRASRTIAVVGLSPRTSRPSHEVAAYLQEAGYRIVPVRPGDETILGEPSYPDLRAAALAAGPIDIVNIFRRSEALPALLDDLLVLHPRLVWMQVGVADEKVRSALEAAGIPVVMNRCLMVDHPWLTSV